MAATSIASLVVNPCEACIKLLEGGLEETYNIRRGDSFFQDAKNYFSSDKFQEDYEHGDWKGDLNFEGMIEGLPVKLGLGANSNSEQVRLFREKIKQTSSITTTSSFFETVSRSTKNTELAKIYVECLTRICDPNILEDGLDGVVSNTENTATFIIKFRDRFNRGAKIRSFEIRSGGILLVSNKDYSGGYNNGDDVLPEKIITAPRDPDKDLVLTMDTDSGTKVLTVSSSADLVLRSNRIPIGTIVTSILDFDNFSISTNNHDRHAFKIYSSELSFWAPCDGRLIKNSDLARLLRKDSLPNLRGVFLRGLNSFGGSTTDIPNDIFDEKFDPDNRQVGSRQTGSTKLPTNPFIVSADGSEHSHSMTVTDCHQQLQFDKIYSGQDQGCTTSEVSTNGNGRHTHRIDGGDIETRPVNVAVNYYIRINN